MRRTSDPSGLVHKNTCNESTALLSTLKCNLLMNVFCEPSILPSSPVHSTSWLLLAFWHEQITSDFETFNTKSYFPINLILVQYQECTLQHRIILLRSYSVPLNFPSNISLGIIMRITLERQVSGGSKGRVPGSPCKIWQRQCMPEGALLEHLCSSYPCLPECSSATLVLCHNSQQPAGIINTEANSFKMSHQTVKIQKVKLNRETN